MEDERLPLNRMRASDAERDLTVEHLTTAFVEGRLDHEEYDHRVGLALGAVLLGELRSLTADLPVPGPSVHGPPPGPGPAWSGPPDRRYPRHGPRPETARTDPGFQRDPRPRCRHEPPAEGDLSVLSVPWREWGDEWRWWLGVAVLLTSVWGVVSLLDGELVPYWPLVPLGIWASVLLASAIWPSEEEPP
ncbi:MULTISPECIES: DUF1707 SHOCT-like domain-containing protein [Nocardiopsis]|uniref:DUF1707 domain-containing protein n=1 Tax=Nocardiopsis sinuspersici TaxID=501010 RepID=A0A1V3C2G9_9ACTN|nr:MULTISPECIES: DUF1707 domain-containing protein [Nocardiopsis]OOC54925.1 hypothetical protein NOSIN_14890 [Nocardiopsis sinuspersici]